jgi:di/tricarboxylate transporter
LSFVREVIEALLKEIKGIIREYMRETEVALKKRLQRLLISGIVVSILLFLVISLIGSAALFLLIGQLKYLSTFMPEWQAWDVMGLTSSIIGASLLLVLFIFVRKRLRTKQP